MRTEQLCFLDSNRALLIHNRTTHADTYSRKIECTRILPLVLATRKPTSCAGCHLENALGCLARTPVRLREIEVIARRYGETSRRHLGAPKSTWEPPQPHHTIWWFSLVGEQGRGLTAAKKEASPLHSFLPRPSPLHTSQTRC